MNRSFKLLLCAVAVIASFTGCSPKAQPPAQPLVAQAAEPKIDGVWRYEAPLARPNAVALFGQNNVINERIDLKLSPDGKADFKWKHDSTLVESIEGDWKRAADLLVMARPDSTFDTFRVVAVEQAELRILTRDGRLYRLTRMPN